jgi:hypothetical protein
MESVSGTTATIGAAAVAVLTGIVLTGYGMLRTSITHTVGGSCITLGALIAIGLVLIRSWVCDTRDIRAALSASQREAERERSRYFAAQAALTMEQGRLTQGMAAERRRIATILIREREKMEADFEERRATITCEAYEAGFLMARSGKCTSSTGRAGNLIPFPQQQGERARAREHGVVGP